MKLSEFKEAVTKVLRERSINAISKLQQKNVENIAKALEFYKKNKHTDKREPFIKLLKKLGKEKIVLMSSHILQEIQATVDRIIIINEGSIVADGSSESLLKDSAGGKVELSIDVSNANENDIKDMKATIPSIDIDSITKNDSYTNINIEYSNNKDPRADIFNYAVSKKWVILEMVATKQNLEDIFRNLTSNGKPS